MRIFALKDDGEKLLTWLTNSQHRLKNVKKAGYTKNDKYIAIDFDLPNETAGRPRTNKQTRDEIIRLHNDGLSCRQISKRLDKPVSTVGLIIKQHNDSHHRE